MTADELRLKTAEKVMEWAGCMYSWEPDQNIAQAFEIARAMWYRHNVRMYIEMDFGRDDHHDGHFVQIGDDNNRRCLGLDLPRVICEVALAELDRRNAENRKGEG